MLIIGNSKPSCEQNENQNEIKQDGNQSWKQQNQLGTLLETDKDISRRKFLAIAWMENFKYIFFNRKLSITIKTWVSNCYVVSIFYKTLNYGH